LDPKYQERYRDLYDHHWWWRARTQFIVESLRRVRPPQGAKILDIGCGDGLFFDRLREFGDVEGVEPFADLVSANNPDRDRIYIRRFDNDFQPGKCYSVILMLDVLEHLEEPVAALRHVLSLLSADGIFVATLPAFMSLWTNHDVLNQHFTRYTKSAFRDVARKAGLQIIEERYLYHWTFFAKLGVRLYEQATRRDPTPARVPRDLVNTPLYWLSRIEQTTISRLPIPFGSSLMIIGKHPRQ